MGVDLMEADGRASSYPSDDYYGKATDAYPAGSAQFTKNTKFKVTNIDYNASGAITFDVNGGGDLITLDIKEAVVNEKTTKMILNGRVVILRDGRLYDILGNRL